MYNNYNKKTESKHIDRILISLVVGIKWNKKNMENQAKKEREKKLPFCDSIPHECISMHVTPKLRWMPPRGFLPPRVCTSKSSLPTIDSSPREESYSFVYHASDETSAVQSGSACVSSSSSSSSSSRFLFPWPSSPSLTGCLIRRTIARVRIDPLRALVHVSSSRELREHISRGSRCMR